MGTREQRARVLARLRSRLERLERLVTTPENSPESREAVPADDAELPPSEERPRAAARSGR